MKVTKDTMQPMPENHPTFRRGWSISGVPSLPLADISPTKKDGERKATAPNPGRTREEAIHALENLL